jgi:predicted DCC family thiol-disulfide oxidoreductase YuxK
MAKDSKNKFKFAALQSDAGIEIQKKFGLNPKDLKTFILADAERYYTKTKAALRVAKELKFPWNMSYVFIIVPPFIRNISYSIIAKYRYKWFGKRQTCRTPTPEQRARFL